MGILKKTHKPEAKFTFLEALAVIWGCAIVYGVFTWLCWQLINVFVEAPHTQELLAVGRVYCDRGDNHIYHLVFVFA